MKAVSSVITRAPASTSFLMLSALPLAESANPVANSMFVTPGAVS